jgi:predicted DNA-binding transcriptional regulator YafY
LQATFRLDSIEAATIEILSLGPEIEVLEPAELRTAVADRARQIARLYR